MGRDLVVLCCITLIAGCAWALDNGVALTPPMGWLSWEHFRCNVDCDNDPENCISERLVKQQADHMAADGFLAAGYQYIIIDDCWTSMERDAAGKLQPDPARFPSGIKALADYVHSRGLKMGIYGDIGTHTCGGFPGMADTLELDAQTYADWGVDYLKVDGCWAEPETYAATYPQLSAALNKTGRPIVYSCSWPAYLPDPTLEEFQVPYDELKKYCNLWRNSWDISSDWWALQGIMDKWGRTAEASKGFAEVAGPGAWNDPDMLIVGNKALTAGQARLQMGAWAVWAAPLIMGNDLRALSAAAREVLLNKHVIAISQDALGHQGRLIACPGDCYHGQVWYRQLRGGDVAAAVMNVGDGEDLEACLDWADMGLAPNATMEAYDVFAGNKYLGMLGSKFCAKVAPGDIALVKLEACMGCPAPPALPAASWAGAAGSDGARHWHKCLGHALVVWGRRVRAVARAALRHVAKRAVPALDRYLRRDLV